MLYLLDKDVKTVKWNGIPLHEASSAIVKEEINGDFTLSVRYPITDTGIYQLIKEDMLIKAPTPVLGSQLFRIKKPVENDVSLDITAYHISDDVMQRSIRPVSVVGQGCAMALSQMVQNAKTDLGTFSFTSDIMDSRTFNTTETETLYSVLLDGKHSIVGTWEGELVRDNFALTIKRSRGADCGVVITTHKNLKSYQRTKNSQSVVTRIHAKSTFKAEGAEEETTITVTVDSPLIGNYPYINEKDYENNNAKTVDELRKWAEAKFKNEGIDKISDAIEIEAYELDGQVIHLGDTVNIKSKKHSVDIYKKAIAYEFNALTEEYISITFDDKPGVGGSGVSSGVSNAADVILSANKTAQEVAIERAVRNANKAFDAEFEKFQTEINDDLEKSKAAAELHADNIKQEITTEIAQVEQSMQAQSEEHDRQVSEILARTGANADLANLAKQLAERAQVNLDRTRSSLESLIGQANTKAGQLEQSVGTIRADLTSQARSILAQAQAQTALTNRVTTVETLADGTRSTVADLSRTMNEATQTIASVTNRTRIVEDTLSQTRTQYEALTQTVNAQTGQIESINRKTADLQSGIDGVTERFENLRVGGENLLLGTNESSEIYNSAQSNAEFLKTPYDLAPIFDKYGLIEYTLSFDLRASKAGTVRVYQQNGSGSKYNGLNFYAQATTEWKRFEVTFTPTAGMMNLVNSYLAFYGTYGTGIIPYVRRLKLEKGNIATDWSPSGEDLRSEIAKYVRNASESSAELSRQIQLADGKAVEAKTYTQQTAAAINTRLESLETYKDGESTRASRYFTASRDETARQVTALRTAVTNDYVAKSTFEENARGVTQRFESLYVGGTNLLRGTDEHAEIFNSEQSHAEFLRTPYDLAEVFDKYGLVKYTLSFDLKAPKTGQIAVYQQNGSGSKYSGLWKPLIVTTEWQRFHVTFTPTEGTMSLANSYLAFYGTYGTGVKPIVRRVKIERGTIATDWSPSPEDAMNYSDTKIAEYKNTVDGQLVNLQTQVNDKATQSDVNGLSGRLSTAETSIHTQAGQIEQRLTSTQVEQAITGKGYQTKTQVDNNITGRGYITSSALQPYALSTTVQNLVKETSDSFSRTISQVENKIPTELGSRNYILNSRTVFVATNNRNACPKSVEKLKEGNREYLRIRRTNPTLNPQLFSIFSEINKFSSEMPTSGKGKISFKARASTAVEMNVMGIVISGTTTSLPWDRTQISIGTEWKTYSFDFEFVKGMTILRANPLQILPPVPNLAEFYLDLCEWQLEAGPIPTAWSPATEDLATVTALHDVKDTVSSHTRTIGAVGETGSILDNVSKVTQTANGLVTEVTGEGGIKSQVSQLKNSWAVKNLSSSGQIIQQINLSEEGFLVDVAKIRLKGKTLADEIRAIDGKFGTLFVADGTFAKLNANVIDSQTITADKLKVDQAFFTKFMANDAYLKQLFTKSAFITQVQAVTMSASQISGGILTATNGAMQVNLNAGQIMYYTDQAALKRVLTGYPTQFVKFATGTVSGKGNAGVTVIGSNRWNSESSNDGGFVGIRAWNGANIDSLDLVGDEIRLASSAFDNPDGWDVKTLDSGLRIAPHNRAAERNSRIEVGDVWIMKGNGTYSSLRDILNAFNGNFSKGPNADSYTYYPNGF
ncbi:phage tail spike protein [Streptococcus suis]